MVEHDVQPYAEAWRQRLTDERRAGGEAASAARAVATRCAEVLAERFDVARVYLFGSASAGSRRPFGGRSDLDLGVEGLADERYVEAMRVLADIADGRVPVDLVPLETASVSLRRAVLERGDPIYERA